MGRFIVMSFFIICFMFSINILNMLNVCYEYGSLASGCPNEAGTGHAFLPGTRFEPLFGYTFKDADGNTVDMSNPDSFNQTMMNAAKYRPAPAGITDIFGFFSWVITGVRLIVNVFITPFYGLPMFLTNNFHIPAFITMGFGAILGLVQLLGVYEFATGRSLW
jgi:hypothetical protein